MATTRAAAVNIDVDSLVLYYRLHGLDEATATDVVWTRGIVRFAELLEEVGIKATFFVVASDLERSAEIRKIAGDLASAGHELASHSYSHPYALTRMSPMEIGEELDRASAMIAQVRGQPVSGFRAPGYNMSDMVYDLLRERGYAYDSSVFPSPPYYLAKAAVMAKMRLFGETTEAILGNPKWTFHRRLQPHRHRGVVELPITVLPGIRFWFIGTSLLMVGKRGYQIMRPIVRRIPFVNLEFHGIDLCDLETDGIDRALLRQPDLRVPIADKIALFRTVLSDLRDSHGVDTLERLAPILVPAQ